MALKTKKKNTPDFPAKCGPKELAKVYADKFGVSQKSAEEAIRNTVDVICEALTNGSTISFMGQFSIEVSTRAERQGRNPKTGEAMTIAASKVAKFKAGSALKKAINE